MIAKCCRARLSPYLSYNQALIATFWPGTLQLCDFGASMSQPLGPDHIFALELWRCPLVPAHRIACLSALVGHQKRLSDCASALREFYPHKTHQTVTWGL